ncbi:trypsin-like serine protease [Aquimarina sp. D1M17]|uniref:trypsin-like serine protease n=1 Tax=Aquimarina acroporae TaxID=2937283 RepID=UPI0020C009BA|nr:trypsin-like serine protease [Aquimarina acroporae]MCK8521800.1 trypsin-like serine protease [Aquimarina acroporae]
MLTRHDKDEAEFLKLAERFEKYICHLNLPDCEGTIIADQWAITAAHCAIEVVDKFKNGKKHFVIINDIEIEVDKVIMHPSWMVRQNSDDNDIALIHLKSKPIGALKAKLYMDTDEVDKLIYMIGRGHKGNGLIGVNGNDGKQRGATNRIERTTQKWLYWTFDHPNTKTKYLTEYEGISGPGDSGGPAFILKNDIVYLAGISSGQDQKGGDEGLYGVEEYYTRVSHYIKWIHEEMTGKGDVSNAKFRTEPKPDAIDDRPKVIDVDPKIFKQYVGEYDVQGTTVKIYTEDSGTKLYLFVADQQSYELVPTGEHQFTFKISNDYKIEFKNSENGVFQELIVTQPDGTYKATRK